MSDCRFGVSPVNYPELSGSGIKELTERISVYYVSCVLIWLPSAINNENALKTCRACLVPVG